MRRAFILADLGRWKEALPLLKGIESPREYKEGVAFYLGYCYASAGEYSKAKPCLIEALNLGLPPRLESWNIVPILNSELSTWHKAGSHELKSSSREHSKPQMPITRRVAQSAKD